LISEAFMPLEEKGFYDFGPFTLRVLDKTLVAGNKQVDLSPKAVDVLMCLIAHRGAFVSRQELIRSVWQANVSDDAVYRQISDIRKSLARFDDLTEYIENKKGQGWRFVASVEKWSEPPTLPPSAQEEFMAESSQPIRKRWSIRAYAAVAAIAVIAAGGVVKIEGGRSSEPSISDYRQITRDGLPKEGRLLTDGRLVYFSEHVSHDADSDLRLAAVPVSGSEVAYPPTPGRPEVLFDIDVRTGDRLYSGGRVVEPELRLLWKSKEGSMEPVGAAIGGASISPDGALLTYGDEHHNLTIRDLGPAHGVRDVFLPGEVDAPRWSGDGQRIRFAVFEQPSLSPSLWEVRRDGSNLHRLPIPGMHGKHLGPEGWTADGRYFIFSEYGGLDHHSSLWIVSDDRFSLKRAKPVRLSAPIDFRSAAVAGDRTIFAIGTNFRNELVRFDLERRTFIPFWEGFPAIDISFSNDGAWAAFAHYPECTLWISRADGSDRRQITLSPIEAHQPHWSPDGRRVAFMGQMPGKPWRIYIVNTSGGVAKEVKPDDSFDQGVPSWSADGRSLVFGELNDRKPGAEMAIRVLDLATGTETILPGSNGKWSPRWSPDGRYILAQTADFKELALFDCKSHAWRRLARLSRIDDANWSGDTNFVHFAADTERGRGLFRVRIDDGKVEQLAPQPEFEYGWSGVAPDGSPLTLRSTKIEEIYALSLRLP
jgi:DNA-binding winged helix-turn-helix (wHTH) protein